MKKNLTMNSFQKHIGWYFWLSVIALIAIAVIFQYSIFAHQKNIKLNVDILEMDANHYKKQEVNLNENKLILGTSGVFYYKVNSFFEFIIYQYTDIIFDWLTLLTMLIYFYLFVFKLKFDKTIYEGKFLMMRLNFPLFIFLFMMVSKMYALQWIYFHFYEITNYNLRLNSIIYSPFYCYSAYFSYFLFTMFISLVKTKFYEDQNTQILL